MDVFDAGYHANRTWRDINGDGTSDYCALKGNPPNVFGECLLSLKSGGFGTFVKTSELAVPCFLTDVGCAGDEPALAGCAVRTEIGKIESLPEFKWENGLQVRDSAIVVFADACFSPEDIKNRFASEAKECLRTSVAIGVLAALLADPEAALPAFEVSVTGCIATKGIPIDGSEIKIWSRQRSIGDWRFAF